MKMNHKIHSYVYETTDYSFFSHKYENRDHKKSESHVKKLASEMKKHGQKIPVIVDAQGNIYDGSHRVEACKLAGLPVLYIVDTNAGIYTMQVVNANMKQWSIKDHVEFHAKTGKREYIKLLEVHNKSGIPVNFICEIASGRNNQKVKDGLFSCDDWGKVDEFVIFHAQLKNHIKASNGQGFVNALFQLWSLKKTDRKRLFQKLVENKGEFVNNAPKSIMTEKMLEVYNQNLKSEKSKISYFFTPSKEIEIQEEII
jgi:hypothetical protein